MTAFLITFKPATENPKRGWPLAELQRLVRQLTNGEPAEESWRFINRKDAQKGDRAFLLLQGKGSSDMAESAVALKGLLERLKFLLGLND